MTLLMQLTDVAGKGRLEPVTAAVNAGEILHLVGPNGAGKSTLLARMAGLTTGEGEITFLGQSLVDWLPATLASRRGYLVQQQVPPFAMPVWHYLTLHLSDKNQVGLLNEVAAALGLDDKLTRQANQLSGGEWQRVRGRRYPSDPSGGKSSRADAAAGRADERAGRCPTGSAGYPAQRAMSQGDRHCDEQP